MNFIAITSVLTALFYHGIDSKLWFNPHNAFPWKKDMKKEEYKNKIELRILDKEWFPRGDVPEVTGPDFPTVKQAEAIFRNEENQYKYYNLKLEKADELLTTVKYGYEGDHPSIFVIHTISGDAQNYFVSNVMTALVLREYQKKFNVFAFNMPELQDSMEQTIVKSSYGRKGNYEGLGETIGEFLDSVIKRGLMKLSQIHLLGFCYSSQLAGSIARYISLKNNDQKIASITALDPFSLGLSVVSTQLLSRHDAAEVHAIHTNSHWFGTLYRRAKADFNFNNAMIQPGCLWNKSLMCSHRRAATAFWYIILYPELFRARKCISWEAFKLCLCNRQPTVPITFPPTPGAEGSYFLNTLSHKPYGEGEAGAHCFNSMGRRKTNKEKKKEGE